MVKNSDYIIDVAFDILSMVALFLVPRCVVHGIGPPLQKLMDAGSFPS